MADVAEVLHALGGSARFGRLRASVSARQIRNAVAAGAVERVAKGLYRLPALADPITTARSQGGVVSHQSAAQRHGLSLLERPQVVHVTVPRGQHRRAGPLPCVLHWADDVPAIDDVTTVRRTVLDCARTLPFREALVIADSALRDASLVKSDLVAAATALRGAHRRRVCRVAELADARAESPLESALRSILIEAGITGFIPQVVVEGGVTYRIDLGHPELRIALEADGFEHHGTRKALARDCRRHTGLTIRGWRLLRFTWEDVIYDPDWVIESVRAAIAGPPGHHNLADLAA